MDEGVVICLYLSIQANAKLKIYKAVCRRRP
jgi:hypothetical protein